MDNQCKKVIAINVNPLSSVKTTSGNLRGILERTIHLVIHPNTEQDKRLADIYIEPRELTKYSLYAIHRSQEIFDIG